MKTTVAMALLAAILISAPAWAQYVTGSPHDLSVRLGTGEICLSCHVPHNAPNAAYGPLWNHALTSGNGTAATFVGPASGGFIRNGAATTLYGNSLLCMGCHDGVTAVGDFSIMNVNVTVNDTTNPIQSVSWARKVVNGAGQTVYPNEIGMDLTYVHPLGIVYPALGTATTSFHTATASSGYGGVTNYTIGGSTGITLEIGATANVANTIGCSTCHNPHDDTTAPPFLIISNSKSALCLTCHIK
ncbi:MAG: cytochrome c3 family protein [Candidatus Brocadiia bacterium]|jgi:predicted CXXCH cytochrome family protein